MLKSDMGGCGCNPCEHPLRCCLRGAWRCVQEQNAEAIASESATTRLLTCNGRTMEFEESATFGASQADLTVRAIT